MPLGWIAWQLQLQCTGKHKRKLHTIFLYMKGDFSVGVLIHPTCTCRYLNINQLKNPFQMNIIWISCPTYFTVSCRPNTLLMWAWSCVEFVLPKMLPRINIVFELLQDRKGKVTQYGLYEKGIFWVAFRSALLVGSLLLISWKILI